MIVSHRHRFVFLHVPKTAGSALRDRLQAMDPACECGWHWGWSPDMGRYVDRAHVPMRDLEASAYHRRVLREYFTFAVVRDPHERFVSGLLEHLRQHRLPVTGQSVRQVVEDLDPFRVRFDARFVHLCPMHEFTHLGLRRRFDHLLRFEHLEEDLGEMCALTGLDGAQLLPLGRVNASASDDRARVAEALAAPDLQRRVDELCDFDWTLFSAYYPRRSADGSLVERAGALAGLPAPERRAVDAKGVFLPGLPPLADAVARAATAEGRVAELQAALEGERLGRAASDAALDAERRGRVALAARVSALEAEQVRHAEAAAQAAASPPSPPPPPAGGLSLARLRRNLARELRKAADLLGGSSG